MFKTIQTDEAPAAIGPYSQAVQKENFLFISGQLPINPETQKIQEGIEQQAEQIMENIRVILSASGFSISDVVKNTIFLKSIKDFVLVNEIYNRYFGDYKPARVTVEVNNLPKDALIEIDSIAIK